MIDTHAHLNDKHYNDILPEVIARAQDAGLTGIINVGFDLASSQRAVELAEEHDWMYAAVGVHPHTASEVDQAMLEQLIALAQHERVVAIGEIGLDYHYENPDRESQKRVFLAQLKIARELDLPVIIHSRDATADTVEILQDHRDNRCVLHCFSGSLETAKIYLEMGHYISFAGPITFKNARNLTKVAAGIPLERLFIETDCPYLAPVPNRGKPNEPAWVRHVADKLAELQEVSPERVIAQTTANASKFFNITP